MNEGFDKYFTIYADQSSSPDEYSTLYKSKRNDEFAKSFNEFASQSSSDLSHNLLSGEGYSNDSTDGKLSDDVMSIVQALLHYISRDGNDLWTDINYLPISSIGPEDFNIFSNEVQNSRGQLGKKTLSLGGKALKADKPLYWVVGHVQLSLEGTLHTHENGWLFDGAIHAQPETYDFHESNHREAIPELMTRLGMYIPGKTYTIHIRGSRPVSATGSW